MKWMMAFILALAVGCASSQKRAEIPKVLQPNGGKTQARSESLGKASMFVK
jgi:hypothetical protein